MNITAMCTAYDVSTSGYYTWLNRKPSQRDKANHHLAQKIRQIHAQSHGIYGSPRITAVLQRQGHAVGKNRVARIMQAQNVVGRIHKKKRKAPGIHDLIARTVNKRLVAPEPTDINQVWVGDVTYLRCQKRWWYLAVVMDLYSRKVIGWSLERYRRHRLTMQAIRQAIKNRQPKNKLLFHSDRGVEYAAGSYRSLLEDHHIEPSMNRPGHCTDNAHMESFFHSLKGEWIGGVKYATVVSLRASISDYIMNFYNQHRLHSSLNYVSPNEFERHITR